MMPIFTGGGWVLLVEFGTFIQFVNVLGKLFLKPNCLFDEKTSAKVGVLEVPDWLRKKVVTHR